MKRDPATPRTARRVIFTLAAMTMATLPVLGGATGHAATSTIGTWELTDSLNVVRFGHSSTLLANGRVLAAGGRTTNTTPTPPATFTNHKSSELYDPITEEWTLTGSMTTARFSHTATLLNDGRVLVVGGFTDPPSSPNQPITDTAELYDPATGTWTPTDSLDVRRALHGAAKLPDGKVLVAGGRTCDLPPPDSTTCVSTNRTATAEVYDPATGLWTPTQSMSTSRHTTTAVALLDGRVLMPAGFAGNSILPGGISDTADIYDPTTGTWSLTGPLNIGRSRSGGILLPDGRALVAMGFRGPAVPNPTTETYDPATNTWSLAGNIDFQFSRFNFHFGTTANGMGLIAGGQFFAGATNSGIVTNSHIFDPTTNFWTNTAPLNEPHGTPGGIHNSVPMVTLSASPTSYVANPAVCGRHCGKTMLAGDSLTGSTELFTAPNTCFGFNATRSAPRADDPTLTGTRLNDVIIGLGGNDRIAGLAGDDYICGGEGNDQIAAGSGDDVVLGEAGTDMVAGEAGNDHALRRRRSRLPGRRSRYRHRRWRRLEGRLHRRDPA